MEEKIDVYETRDINKWEFPAGVCGALVQHSEREGVGCDEGGGDVGGPGESVRSFISKLQENVM